VNTAPDSNLSQQAGELGPGNVLDRYELLLPVAAGGMAMVWAARLKGTRGFQKIVAVKTMLPKLSEDEQFEQMFLDEASLASEIHHPHIVEILDLGEYRGVLYLVMEWIDGVPLNQLMKAARAFGGIPISVAVRMVLQACTGLHAAHELRNAEGKLVGLVHRDVSPQNIMVTYEGVAKVVDFGVAKATALGGGATVAGQIKGKVAYMAPEQIKGGRIDRRVDIFALGIVLYALTTGKHPFRRESEAATMYNICAPQPVMPPRKVIADYPPEVERIITKALAKDADKRYQTANEMLRDLDQLPPHLRASTDQEVADFVKKLFTDKREERHAALANALALADEHAKNRQSSPHFTAEAAQQLINTSVSVVTGSGGLHDGIGTGVVTAAGQHSGRRRLVFIATVATSLLLGLGVVAAIALRPPHSDAVPAASASQLVQSIPSIVPPVVATTNHVSAPTVDSAPSVASADDTANKSKQKSASGASALAVTPPRVTPTPNPTPTANAKSTAPKDSKSWKHDPGF
jgi:eukaryotic-like serine/threonine-protein kinase